MHPKPLLSFAMKPVVEKEGHEKMETNAVEPAFISISMSFHKSLSIIFPRASILRIWQSPTYPQQGRD
jgi:hypothetical protein